MQLNLAPHQSRCLTRALPSPSQRLQTACHRRQQGAAQQACRAWRSDEEHCSSSGSLSLPAVLAPLGLWLASSGVADAATDFSKGSYAKESYWATLGLFIISFPGDHSACPSYLGFSIGGAAPAGARSHLWSC